jgi:hypothetical protein
MVGLSVSQVNDEFRHRGQIMFVDTDGRLMVWGLSSRRQDLTIDNADQMKRFLVAMALREVG